MECEEVAKLVPCRREQLHILGTLMGERSQPTVPSVYLYGHSSTGKTLVTRSLLDFFHFPHVFVYCVECYTSRILFEQILNRLSGHSLSAAEGFTGYSNCDNMGEFVRLLQKVIDGNSQLSSQTVYIVLLQAERLRDMDMNLLPGFLRLQELTGRNVCVVLESEIVWSKFWFGTGFLEPMLIHFPEYSKEELNEILISLAPADQPTDLYMFYSSLVVNVFHTACRNLRELAHMAELNFPKFMEPVRKGEATVEDTRKLWRNIEPHLKKSLQTVYLREVSSIQWEKMQAAMDSDSSFKQQQPTSRANMELPYYSKFLLIAAYLASYNPAKSDRRFFAKNAGRINKTTVLNVQKKQARTSSQLLGPKQFALDRLMAIFYSIIETKVAPSAHLSSQISSLVSLGLLSQISGSDMLESPKYKCLVTLDFIRSVSRNVGFEVVRYLYDYVG